MLFFMVQKVEMSIAVYYKYARN